MHRGLKSVWAVVATVLGLAAGCDRPTVYSQETPDDVIRSAAEMIRNGETQRLPDLIAADNDEMRRMLNRLGVLFGNMQQLAKSSQERFPDEMAKIRAEAERRAAAGEGNPILSALGGGGGGQRNARGEDQENAVRDLVNRLFADPYGWLSANASRLSTEKIADDQATVLLDGKPLIPVIGLPMLERDGKWYISLPTNMPPLSAGWPRSKPQWDIVRALLTVVDKAVIEMTEDVRQGRVGTLDRLALNAQEKMLMPAGISFIAYQREIEVRSRLDRRLTQFRTRLREWVKHCREKDREVSPSLLQAIERIAPVELEKMVRKRTPLAIDTLSNAQFEDTVSQWLAGNGLSIALDGLLDGASVDALADSWIARQSKASTGKK